MIKGSYHSRDTKRKMSEVAKGRHHTEEAKIKIGKAQIKTLFLPFMVIKYSDLQILKLKSQQNNV